MADLIKLLDFYTEKDHEILFGRDEEIKSLIHLLHSYPIIIMSGESGTGKTSIIRAGLIPLLDRDTIIIYHRLNPDSKKILAEKLLLYLENLQGVEKCFEKIVMALTDKFKKEGKKCIIILDQFEELLVEYQDGRNWFPVKILSSISNASSIQFLFCLRSDYLPLFMMWLHPTRLHFFAEQFYYLTRFSEHIALQVLQQILSYQNINPGYDQFSHITTLLAELDVEGTVYPPHLQIIASYLLQQAAQKRLSDLDFTVMNIKEIEKILSGFFNKELFKDMTDSHRKIVKQVLDTLVGREGLRRKLTLNELSIKIKYHEDDLLPLLNKLIERRTLRRNEEDKFELVHDFLSRHFFESFNTEEKHNRRLQDMFTTAMMDYRDAGILLDERRIRLFLHYRDILDLDKEARLFLIKSVLSLFVIGYNPYLDISMNQDLLELLRIENNKDNRLSIIAKLNTITGYNDLPYLKELYEKENDYMAKTDILTLIAELDPDWVKKICEDHLGNWETLHETYLEGLLRAIRSITEAHFSQLILPILSEHSSDSIQLASLETIEAIKNASVIPDLLTFLEEKKIKIARVIDSCILTIDNLLYTVQEKSEYESLKRRFISTLKKLIYKSVYVSQPNAFTAYIKHSEPDPSECESLLTTTQDNYNIESIIRAMGEIGDSAYRDTLLFFIQNTDDNTYIETAISSLGRLQENMDFELYRNLYKTYSSSQIRYIIIDNLVDSEYREAIELFRSIIKNKDETDSTLLMKATGGLHKFGNEDDIQLLKSLVTESQDIAMKEHYIEVISNFNTTYAPIIKKTLKEIWNNEQQDSLRILTACKLFLLGDSTFYPFLLSRLSRIDEHFEKYIQQSLFAFTKDPVVEIFRVFLKHKGPFPEPDTVQSTLQDIVLHAANREYACIALTILGAFFGTGIQDWFHELLGTANRPELRGLALLAIAEDSRNDILALVEDRLFTSNWPLTQKFALYALGILNLDGTNHENRISILDHFIRETTFHDLLDHAIWVYYACGTKNDCENIEQLLSDERGMKIRNSYFIQRLENTLMSIKENPLEDRDLPLLENLYKIENYWWRQSLRLSPMIFTI
ncbi:MAG: hypothetical protein JXB88_02050 [Spirochaetales bacterium]|nr:hypothetical protein [Spirochaetales bacterium]